MQSPEYLDPQSLILPLLVRRKTKTKSWIRQPEIQPSSDRSTKEPTALRALPSWDGSLPPASAISGLPPPLPPTIAEISFTSFPAWILDIMSDVTVTTRAAV